MSLSGCFTVTRPFLVGCLNWWWLPDPSTSYQPSAFSILITSLDEKLLIRILPPKSIITHIIVFVNAKTNIIACVILSYLLYFLCAIHKKYNLGPQSVQVGHIPNLRWPGPLPVMEIIRTGRSGSDRRRRHQMGSQGTTQGPIWPVGKFLLCEAQGHTQLFYALLVHLVRDTQEVQPRPAPAAPIQPAGSPGGPACSMSGRSCQREGGENKYGTAAYVLSGRGRYGPVSLSPLGRNACISIWA